MIRLTVFLFCFLFLLSCQKAESEKKNEQKESPPNIVLIFADDLGYGDLSCYGSETISTPHLDGLAKQGMKFMDFHVTSSVCTPSRASLLTGCYPDRVSLPKVLFPDGAWGSDPNIGINPDEETLAELLKQRGYATAMAGKWHLGHKQKFLPLQHGFDRYLGVPYSNDMPIESTMPLSENINLRNGMTREMIQNFESLEIENKRHQTPLLENNQVIEFPADQTTLTKRYTEFCIEFIKSRAAQSPFFVYLAHTMPHIPIFASDEFEGKSKGGLYGDVIEEIDWSVGAIVEALEKIGIRDNTLFIFTSDNGPWLSYGNHGGTTGGLRGGKFDIWEGGFRVPAIISWPGVIPKNEINEQMITTLDILPTLINIAGASMPQKQIDGINVWPAWKNEHMNILEERYFYYFNNSEIRAVRKGNWKYVAPHTGAIVVQPGMDGINGKSERIDFSEALYDLKNDVAESENVIREHPELQRIFKSAIDSFSTAIFSEARPLGIDE